jgi:uncharacterized protein YeaO (DUF488 family)
MSRHTLNDGITPDKSITNEMFDEWQPLLAPSPTLLGEYYIRGLPWHEFEEEFKAQLDRPLTARSVQIIAELAMDKNVTLLCTEQTPEQCHRRIIAERCQFIIPELVTIIS